MSEEVIDKVTGGSTSYPIAAKYLKSPVTTRLASADIEHTSINDKADGTSHVRVDLATTYMTTHKPAGDGHIITMMWDSTSAYDCQVWFPDGSSNNDGIPQIRWNNLGTWTSWQNMPAGKGNSFVYNSSLAPSCAAVYGAFGSCIKAKVAGTEQTSWSIDVVDSVPSTFASKTIYLVGY